MLFNYTKIESLSGKYSQDSLEQSQTHAERGRSTIWTKLCDNLQVLRWPTTFFLLSVITVCEICTLRKQTISLPIGAELNGLVPHFSQAQKIFRSDTRYYSDHKTMESINATKKSWMDIMPHGGGFMQIPDYKLYTLPPPIHLEVMPSQNVYGIAVFHELHCLMHMSGYIDKLTIQIRNKDLTIDEDLSRHNDHCVNYLKNAIMCCGDTALEGQSQDFMFDHDVGTDGTGAVHVCRSYDEISAWAEKRRATEGKEVL